MATGTVKWFNDSKGYGFITPDDGSEDLFAHFSAITMNGFKTLKEGGKVAFEVTQVQGQASLEHSKADLIVQYLVSGLDLPAAGLAPRRAFLLEVYVVSLLKAD
ncbi:hypothetical protein BVRB_036120 [Beta vulgaris subsp. vulgaris]|uniref:CSD domain-containing protein n=1 Tax=Beta vulgaris subsp. vulgaris TaxID=3555 RepID=A0A0J8BI95_BETVV|nr:hypothetical protein BVRB_036120 [Beta vulgaris subsp. vulgaris]